MVSCISFCNIYTLEKSVDSQTVCAFLFCSPDVAACGYTRGHPSENTINFRIQARESE